MYFKKSGIWNLFGATKKAVIEQKSIVVEAYV